jgi:hypothetical protein
VEWTVLTELEPEVPANWANLGHTLDLLGRLPEAEAAERHEARFLALWGDPDPALRPRVEAVKVRQHQDS